MVDIEKIIYTGIQKKASDIHLVKGMKPILRINKDLTILDEMNVLDVTDIENIYNFFIKDSKELNEEFNKKRNLDINYEFLDCRLRVNISKSMDFYIFTIRIIKKELPDFNELKLPNILRKISLSPQGLILVTGKSNSGKSTTLNALVNEINKTENKKILMLENPIEYMHVSKKSLIIQKEIGFGKDCYKYIDGVTNALREDCDILVVGEIRDKETMEATIEMAEAGHLVIGTMHTRSCAETIDRILGFFNLSDQMTIKYLISSVLKIVISQRLLKGTTGELVMVPEIMIVDEVVGGLIRKEKFSTSEIEDAIQSRMDKGNLSLINSLARAVIDDKLTITQAEKQLDSSRYEQLSRTIRQLDK